MDQHHAVSAGSGPSQARQQDGCVTFEVLCMAPDCQARVAVRPRDFPTAHGIRLGFTPIPGRLMSAGRAALH